jgi:hypothetical protein
LLAPVDAPLGEAVEQYRVTVEGSGGSIELLVSEPAATIAAADLAAIGAGSVTIEVRQVGDLAASHPAHTSISLS